MAGFLAQMGGAPVQSGSSAQVESNVRLYQSVQFF
jgi:hypothetical protein